MATIITDKIAIYKNGSWNNIRGSQAFVNNAWKNIEGGSGVYYNGNWYVFDANKNIIVRTHQVPSASTIIIDGDVHSVGPNSQLDSPAYLSEGQLCSIYTTTASSSYYVDSYKVNLGEYIQEQQYLWINPIVIDVSEQLKTYDFTPVILPVYQNQKMFQGNENITIIIENSTGDSNIHFNNSSFSINIRNNYQGGGFGNEAYTESGNTLTINLNNGIYEFFPNPNCYFPSNPTQNNINQNCPFVVQINAPMLVHTLNGFLYNYTIQTTVDGVVNDSYNLNLNYGFSNLYLRKSNSQARFSTNVSTIKFKITQAW